MSDYKVRNDYIKAANRHLCVCIELKKRIIDFENDEQNGRFLNKEEKFSKEQLLCDLYYLTGYIIECSCSAAIFHYFPAIASKRDLDDSVKKIRFKEKKDYFGVANSNHTLHHFTNAFSENHLNQRSIDIPLLNGKDLVFQQNNCFNLLDFGKAMYRRLYSPIPNFLLKKNYYFFNKSNY